MNLSNELLKKLGKNFNENVNLSNYSWFNLGGNAEFFYKAQNIDQLKEFLKELKKKNIKVTILGAGSNARSLTKDDFEMYVVRVNVFENVENANALKKNINNYFPAYTEALPNNNALTAVYVGPFRTKEDIDKNIDFIYEISETNSGEVVLWKP